MMRTTTIARLPVCAMLALLGGVCAPAVQAATAPPAEAVTGAWQHHEVTFTYVGFTSLYTCNGLESHVRQILLHLGARKDLAVSAVGCPGPQDGPSHTAWVHVDFHTLAPATGPDAVNAQWSPLAVTPNRPSFMGDGDCELIESMKDLITHNFTLRDVEYRTSCMPHQNWPDSYAVKGQALSTAPTPSPAQS